MKTNYRYSILGFVLVATLVSFGTGQKAKVDVTTACRYDVGISGTSSVVAGGIATFDASVYPSNCTSAGNTAISISQDISPSGAAGMPACSVDTSSLNLPTSGVVKAKINCATTSSTTAGYYKYYANFSPVNGVTPMSTWFTFSVTAPAATCPILNFKLTDTKTSYLVGDMVNYSYVCADGTNTSSVAIQLSKPDGTNTTYVTGSNVGSVLQQMGFSTSNLTPGSYTLKAVLGTGTTYPLPFTVTATTATSMPTLMGTIFKDGQYVEQGTFTLRSCVSPNAWMNEGATTSGARSFHCMPNYTQTSSDIPPTPCVGTLWSGLTGGTSTGSDYCATTKSSTTTTTTTSCPSGWYWSGSSCVQSSTTTTTTTTDTTTTSGACANGTKCSAGSWCQSGQQFYYPDGQLTCVAWSNDGTQPQAPAGTSVCKPTDTSCVAPGQTVPFTSGSNKYCTNGMAYYSSTQMTCVAMSGTMGMSNMVAPAGFSACKPGESSCKSVGDKWTDTNSSYYCSGAQKCNLSPAGGTCVGWNDSCPSGTKYCSATDSNCIEPGEYKTLPTSSTNGTNSFWCGGSSGMTLYSATQAYCEPKKAGSGMGMMMTSADLKAILAKLGSGWGVCPPKNSSSNSGTSQCIEPGQTGPSGSWCGWMSPSTTMNMNMTSGTTRTCPGLDETTTIIKDPIKEICPLAPSVSWCPAGQHIEKTAASGNCGGTTYCKADDVKSPICPAVMPVKCAEGQTYAQGSSANGCSYTYCTDGTTPKITPMPIPPALPTYPQYDNCRMARDQARGYKYEVKQFDQYMIGVKVPEELKTLIKSAKESYDVIEKLFTVGTKIICTEDFYQPLQAQVIALGDTMNILRQKAANVQAFGQCAQFQKDLDQRLKMLEQDAKRMSKTKISIDGEVAQLKALSAKTPEICKTADQYTTQDLNYERQNIEEKINDKFNQNATAARDSFITDTVDNILGGIDDARQEISDKNLSDKAECQKVENLFTQVENLAHDAQTAYESNKTEEAGQILDKIFRFKDPVTTVATQCGISFHIDEEKISTDIYANVNAVDEAMIKAMVDKAVEKITKDVTDRFTAILDEKIKQLSTRMAQVQVSEKAQVEIQNSIATLQDVPKDVRSATEDAKNSTIDTLAALDKGKAQINARLYERIYAALERAAASNFFGDASSAIAAQATALKLHAEAGDVTTEDALAFEETLAAAEKQNMDECYRVGACRFRDTDPSSWYYGYLQNSTAFKGDGDTKNVGPGRQALRAEALIAIERAAGITGIEGSCSLTATGVKGVPDWANCAVNAAVENNIVFNGPLSEPASRDEVASWMVAFEKDHLPVVGTNTNVSGFRDMKSCRDSGAVSYIVANKIMTGYGGDRVGTWGCGQPLLRAELAAVLERLTELLSLTK